MVSRLNTPRRVAMCAPPFANGKTAAYAHTRRFFFGVVRQALLASVAYSLEFSYNACKNAVCESRLWDARLFGMRFIFWPHAED